MHSNDNHAMVHYSNLNYAQYKTLCMRHTVTYHYQVLLPSSGTVNNVVKKTTSYTKCFRCGRINHSAPQCRYKDAVCKKCNKTGHLAKVCQSRKTISSLSLPTKKRLPTNVVSEQTSPSEKHEYALFTIQDTKEVTDKPGPLHVSVKINGKQVSMEIDTGSAVSIMSESKFK